MQKHFRFITGKKFNRAETTFFWILLSLGTNFASLCSLAGRYDDPIPPGFLAPIDYSKFPALSWAGFRIRIDLMRIRIRIQHFFLNTDPDPGSGSKV
jgi:hypothetical protein